MKPWEVASMLHLNELTIYQLRCCENKALVHWDIINGTLRSGLLIESFSFSAKDCSEWKSILRWTFSLMKLWSTHRSEAKYFEKHVKLHRRVHRTKNVTNQSFGLVRKVLCQTVNFDSDFKQIRLVYSSSDCWWKNQKLKMKFSTFIFIFLVRNLQRHEKLFFRCSALLAEIIYRTHRSGCIYSSK